VADVLADAGLTDVDAEFEQLTMNTWRAPEAEMWSFTFSDLCEVGDYVNLKGIKWQSDEPAQLRFT
jgi:hypothetical protein